MRMISILREGPNWGNAGDDTPDVLPNDEKPNTGPNFDNDTPDLEEPTTQPQPSTTQEPIRTQDDMYKAISDEDWYRIAYIMMKEYMKFSDPQIIDYKAKEWLRYYGPKAQRRTTPSNYSLVTQQQGKVVLPVTSWADITAWFKSFLEKHKDVVIGTGSGTPSSEQLPTEAVAALAMRLRNALGGVVDDESEIYNVLRQVGNAANWEALKKQFLNTAKIGLVERLNSRLDILERRNVIKILKDQGITDTGIDKGVDPNMPDVGNLVPGYSEDQVFRNYDDAKEYIIKLFRAYRAQGAKEAEIDDFLSMTSDTVELPQTTWRRDMKENIQRQVQSEEGCKKSYIDLQFLNLIDMAKQRMTDQGN